MKNLAFKFFVSVRTIQCDIAFLSIFYPLMTVQGKHGGVIVVEGYRMGQKYLSQEEHQFLKGLQNNLPDKYQINTRPSCKSSFENFL